jgi:hypothetical protein
MCVIGFKRLCQFLHSLATLQSKSSILIKFAQAFSVGVSAAEPAWQQQLDGWGAASHVQVAADQSGVSAAAILHKCAPWALTWCRRLGVLKLLIRC